MHRLRFSEPASLARCMPLTSLTTRASTPRWCTTVLGSSAMIEARRQRTGSVSRYQAGQIIDDGLHPGWFERVQPTYAAALDHFVRSLDQEGPISPSLGDGLKAQAIAEQRLDL